MQDDEPWLVAMDDQGVVGFVDREVVDWKARGKLKPEKPRLRGSRTYAKPVPGREGYVFNPHTGGIVNVKGVQGGMLVRDPNDPNPNHVFRVPFFAKPARAMIVEDADVALNERRLGKR